MTTGYEDQAGDLAGVVDQLGLRRFTLIGASMGGIIAMTYAGAHAERLAGLVINDIGPDPEAGTQRITQMVGDRPDRFATLDDALAYRRRMSPIVASRTEDDQLELAHGVLRRDGNGAWGWKMDPAYVTQRVQKGPPPSGAATATSCPRSKRCGWSRRCRRVSSSPCPGSATRRP